LSITIGKAKAENWEEIPGSLMIPVIKVLKGEKEKIEKAY
jgi:hypothetical protein